MLGLTLDPKKQKPSNLPPKSGQFLPIFVQFLPTFGQNFLALSRTKKFQKVLESSRSKNLEKNMFFNEFWNVDWQSFLVLELSRTF